MEDVVDEEVGGFLKGYNGKKGVEVDEFDDIDCESW